MYFVDYPLRLLQFRFSILNGDPESSGLCIVDWYWQVADGVALFYNLVTMGWYVPDTDLFIMVDPVLWKTLSYEDLNLVL